MSNTSPLEYCAQLVREHRPDTFLASLYLQPDCRAQLHVLLALNIELVHIADAAKEELIAHMRYAWWKEAIQNTYAGKPPKGHLVLEALTHSELPQEQAIGLLRGYREDYPTVTPELVAHLNILTESIIKAYGLKNEKGWNKANEMIARHRERHGDRRNGWLHLKLLISGLF